MKPLLLKCALPALLLLSLLLGSGCARTVTARLVPVEDMAIKFWLRNDGPSGMNAELFDYYLLLSDTGTPQVPNKLTYFTAPSQTYDPDRLDLTGLSLKDYYSRYFSTWRDFIVINTTPVSPRLYNGAFSPDTDTESHDSYNANPLFVSYKLTNSRPVTLEFSLSYLTATGNNLYITVVTVFRETGIIMDIMDFDTITLEKSNRQSGTQSADYDSLPAQGDLVSWEVEIF